MRNDGGNILTKDALLKLVDIAQTTSNFGEPRQRSDHYTDSTVLGYFRNSADPISGDASLVADQHTQIDWNSHGTDIQNTINAMDDTSVRSKMKKLLVRQYTLEADKNSAGEVYASRDTNKFIIGSPYCGSPGTACDNTAPAEGALVLRISFNSGINGNEAWLDAMAALSDSTFTGHTPYAWSRVRGTPA